MDHVHVLVRLLTVSISEMAQKDEGTSSSPHNQVLVPDNLFPSLAGVSMEP